MARALIMMVFDTVGVADSPIRPFQSNPALFEHVAEMG
jgi:hypothetical protein